LASRKPFYRKTILVYLLAIVAPALVLLYFGVESFRRQRQAVESLLLSNTRLSAEKLAGEVERRAIQAAQECLRESKRTLPGSREWDALLRKHPIARHFFLIDRGRVIHPPLHAPLPLSIEDLLAKEPLNVREKYADRFREAETQEIRQGKVESALAAYREASHLPVSPPLQALACQRIARCLERMNRMGDARQAYQFLGDHYGDLPDLSHRPYALVSALAIGPSDARKKELWHAVVSGRWQMSADQVDYFAALLGGQLDSATSPYAVQLQFARRLEDHFRDHAPVQVEDLYSVAFAANGSVYQTFYHPVSSENGRFLGFAAEMNWIDRELLPRCRHDLRIGEGARIVGKGEMTNEALAIRMAFPSVLSGWELILDRPSGVPAGDGLPVQAAITALVLSLLVLGVVLLLRDLGRDARLNQLRADFVGAVSHELKTPLTVIRLYGETLLDGEDFTAGERRGFYEIITRESDRLTQLIDKVLSFSKIDRGEKQYHLQTADLSAVVSRTVETYETYLKRRGFSLETRLAADLPPVCFDADAVSQALVNLLDNAAKYSGESKSIAVRSYASAGAAVVEVEDHGIGIPPNEQARIFERFYRVGNAVAKGGYGLGLYLVRHIMDAHDGKIELDSEPQRGSRFRLLFPAANTGHQT
jgi:signal transduction histidine kinase